jgi:hypothetical protein
MRGQDPPACRLHEPEKTPDPGLPRGVLGLGRGVHCVTPADGLPSTEPPNVPRYSRCRIWLDDQRKRASDAKKSFRPCANDGRRRTEDAVRREAGGKR